MRHPRIALAAVAAVSLLTPLEAAAQTVYIPDRGIVVDGGRGTAEELQLTDEEAAEAFTASSGLIVGVLLPSPEQVPADFDVDAIVDALSATVERHGARIVRCDTATRDPEACIQGFMDDKAAGFVIIGSQGDLTEITGRAGGGGLTIPVSIGDTKVGPGSVVIESDPLTRAFEQGRAGGAPKGVPKEKVRRSAIVASAVEVGQLDMATDAEMLGLKETAPKVRIVATLGPPAIETTADLAAAVAGLPPSGILIGEGVKLTQATAEGLDALPEGLTVVAGSCTPQLMAVIDLGDRIRACIARDNDGAGEAAGNAILSILIGNDVPGFVDAPLYAYRGTKAVGPGQVLLGRRIPGGNLGVSDAEREAARGLLTGRAVGIVAPWTPGKDEPATVQVRREAIEAGLTALGATTVQCSYGKKAKQAAGCVRGQVQDGVAAIIVLGDRVDLVAPVREALAAGIPVFGSDAAYLGDSGAVYVDLDPRTVARLQGRMAGVYAAATWPANTGTYAVILNDNGVKGRDPISDAIERSATLNNPDVIPVGRFAATAKSAKSAMIAALKQVRGLRMLLGTYGTRGAADLKTFKRPKAAKDLVAFGLTCTPSMKEAIDAGGRVKGCVDVDPAAAGALLVDAMARLFAGGAVPSLIDQDISPYPQDAATPVGTEVPAG